MTHRTTAIILAAGISRRMGTAKALLLWRGKPLIRHLCETLEQGGASAVILVVAPGNTGDRIQAAVADLPFVQMVLNPAPERGMLSSVQAGLSVLPAENGFLLCPCDLPKLQPAQVRRVVEESHTFPNAIVVPIHKENRGHPTWFGANFREEIGALDPETVGLNVMLQRYPGLIREVPVSTDAVWRDTDTPEEWRQVEQEEAGGATGMQGNESFDGGGGELPDDIEEALLLQDNALELLQRLREREPFMQPKAPHLGGGRRDFRRWPTPRGVTIELHDGKSWQAVACGDLGTGGARLAHLPKWVKGPVPARLNAPGLGSPVIVLSDVMWREGSEGKAGIRFEFQDDEEREYWSGALIDALLAEHALQ